MASDTAPGLARSASASRSLEIQTSPDVCMEGLILKLDVLDFTRQFYASKFGKNRSRIHHSYFSSSTPGQSQTEQFFCFMNLAAWLASECGGAQLKPLKEGEDSAAAISQLLGALKSLKFAVPPSFTVQKLQSGMGPEVCGILDGLVDLGMEAKGFQFHPAEQSAEEADGDPVLAEVYEGGDMALDKSVLHSRPEDQPVDDFDMMTLTARLKPSAKPVTQDQEEKTIIENTIDREQWEMEYQQVAPKLQIRVAAEARDWRTHLEAALQDKQGLVKLWPDSQTALKHVQQGILEQLEKVEDRENYLNNEFASRTDEYRNKKEIFIQKQGAYAKQRAECNDGVSELQKYVDQIDDMQGDLDSRSSNRADAGPTVKVKKAQESLSGEMKQMNIQMGVIRHQLLMVRRKALH